MITSITTTTAINGIQTMGLRLLFIGLLFGCEKFEPEKIIKVTTDTVTDISYNSCSVQGNIIHIGEKVVFQHGFCYSRSQNPSINKSTIQLGSINSTGYFSSSLSNLQTNTKYYVRAYAQNKDGIFYGNEIEFNTIWDNSTISDIDGNIYQTVQIGNQIWMKENLKTTHFANSDAIPEGTGAGDISGEIDPEFWFAYNDDLINVSTYGRLYTWYTVIDSRNICPDGWHVPTDAEWTILTNYLGGESVAGGMLKETTTMHWNSPNLGASNAAGFKALPGGYRDYDGSYYNIGYNGYWWSTTKWSESELSINALYRRMNYDGRHVDGGGNHKQRGFSVRCLMD